MATKDHPLETGEITRRTRDDYYTTCERIAAHFGRHRRLDDLRSEDFEGLRADLAKTRGPVALGNESQRVRMVSKYAYDPGLVAAPVRYGPGPKRAPKKTLRKARAARGPGCLRARSCGRSSTRPTSSCG